MGLRKRALDGVHIGATWQIGLNRLCAPFCQITLTTCSENMIKEVNASNARHIGPLGIGYRLLTVLCKIGITLMPPTDAVISDIC